MKMIKFSNTISIGRSKTTAITLANQNRDRQSNELTHFEGNAGLEKSAGKRVQVSSLLISRESGVRLLSQSEQFTFAFAFVIIFLPYLYTRNIFASFSQMFRQNQKRLQTFVQSKDKNTSPQILTLLGKNAIFYREKVRGILKEPMNSLKMGKTKLRKIFRG